MKIFNSNIGTPVRVIEVDAPIKAPAWTVTPTPVREPVLVPAKVAA